jgi:hypothetical protein
MSLIKYSIICGLRKLNLDLKHTGKVNWKAYRWKRFSKNNAVPRAVFGGDRYFFF